MDNQHRHIKTYRGLSQAEIDLMNEGKQVEKEVLAWLDKLAEHPDTDKRCVSLALTNVQQAFMWGIRGVAKPTPL